jgi:hypothetical protein
MIFNIEYEIKKKNESTPLKRKIRLNGKKLLKSAAVLITIFTFGYMTGFNRQEIINKNYHIEKRVQDIDDRLDSAIERIQPKQLDREEEDKDYNKEIIGFCGHMNPLIIDEQSKSSWGLNYYLNYNICEVNESYDWEKLGQYPSPGMFFKITNDFSDLSSWCMVIGTFNDIENKNRIIVISRKVSNEIGVLPDSFMNIPIRLSIMDDNEWRSKGNCREVYKLENIELLKPKY